MRKVKRGIERSCHDDTRVSVRADLDNSGETWPLTPGGSTHVADVVLNLSVPLSDNPTEGRNDTAYNSGAVFGEGDELYAHMLAAIERARNSILMESYIFSNDEIGRRFSAALAERARAGLDVRVHLDAAGTLFAGGDAIFRFLKNSGVAAKWFNRWSWRDPLRYNRRNHRKLLVIDECYVYIGGFNIHRESSLQLVGFRRWRDLHVAISGPLALQAARLFDVLWDNREDESVPPWIGPHRLIPNVTRACQRVLHCEFLNAFKAAKKSIDVCTPYFVPSRRFRAALIAAARRGLAVRVLMPVRSDVSLVDWAAHALVLPLARKRIAFFAYTPRMLHSKVTLIDGRWSMVGSANIDYRSFFVNRELNLISTAPEVCRQIEEQLQKDFSSALPLRPRSGRCGRLRLGLESVGRRIRRWL